ncbi:alpha-2-macroglobulin [Halothiobacillus sp.]|uniref:alpha-2-macroglobulin n=1 Tax=Halothiobacillus sp. TaxID=1891311 RepID=UPI00262CB0EC|nr:alpha-2-macroglobulin [Halothiobacillus sp.]MDD4966458.1 alpha-2-macroglobulin [Halothiobacillus sp.]
MSHSSESHTVSDQSAETGAVATRKSSRFARLFGGLWRMLVTVWVALFGAVSWHAPRWLQRLVDAAVRWPVRTAGIVVVLLALAGGGWWGYQWYQNRPKPIEPPKVQVRLTPPALTDYTQTPLVVQPLVVDFSASVAPIALVGKPAKAGIELSPPVAGQWEWHSDRELIFTPSADWPVGQKYRLNLVPGTATTQGVRLAQTQFDFSTVPFQAQISSREFYQDPQDPLKKSAIFGVSFNYPVDTATFEKAVSLAMLEPDPTKKNVLKEGPPQKFTVTYDLRHLNAYVHSAPLSLPLDEQLMQLTLRKGIASVRGGAGTATELTGVASIPGLYSLGINNASITLVDNERFEPTQTLVIGTTSPVTGKELNAKVKAWLLPVNGPEQQMNYSWYPGRINQSVLARSQVLPLDIQPTERNYDGVHGFRFSAPPGRQLYVSIDRGLTGFGGYQLGKAQSFVLRVPPYPKLLKFLGQGALLSMSGDHRVSVVARNMPGMRVRIARLLPDQLQHLVSMNQGNFEHPRLSISPDHLVQRFTQVEPLANVDPTKAVYSGVDLGQYLGSGSSRKRGVFLLQLSAWNPNNPDQDDSGYSSDPFDAESYQQPGPGDSRLIVVTDLGLLAKRSLDGSRDVFVQSLSTGQPVTGAIVKVIAENGQTLLSATTGGDGHVHFPTLSGFKRELRPVMFTVSHDDAPQGVVQPGETGSNEDFSFLPIGSSDRMLNFSRFDIGGAPNAQSTGELSAYLFSDRGLYRPGDEFHIGLIVRAASWQQNISGLPLVLELVDPRGLTVTRKHISPDQSGFMQWSYTTPETAPTGGWSVNLYLIKQDHDETLLGSTTVQVKEFEPDQTRVNARLKPDASAGWVKPGNLHALIQANTLYGTAADHRRVTATMTLRPAFPSFPLWRDYSFYDPHRAKDGYTETLQTQTTDDKGTADFPLDLSSFASATYSLRFYAQVFEPNSGRNVSAAVTALVSSADYLVGVKTDGDLDFIDRDAKRAVHVLAVNPQLKSIAVPNLKAVILDRHYISVLTRQDSGVFKYESKLKETPVSSQPLTIAAGGSDLPLPTSQPGSYALVIEDAEGTQLNRIDFTVAGNANVSRSLERNAELQLALNKKDYAPGETIDVAVRAPYAGSGLITIERDKVYAWVWFHSDTASSVQHITVPKDFEGNGYINVQFLRDPSSSAIYMSPLSYGVVPFSVDLGAHREAVSVTTPSLIKPGQTLDMTVDTADTAQVALFAVDAGILQVANYKLGDPLDYFFRKRMLQVDSSQILDLMLPSFDQLTSMSTTGGDGDTLRQQQLNPFRRKHEQPVAYWSGVVTVKGRHTFHYAVPDSFNGELKVMVVAVTPQKIGINETETTVRGDFVLSPNLPVAVAPGDAFDASVNVVNNLPATGDAPDQTMPIRVQINAGSAFAVQGDSVQMIDLAAGKSGVVNFKLKALEHLGSAPVKFTATYEEKQAMRSTEVSVRPAVPFQTKIDVGRLSPGQSVTIKPLRDLFLERSERHAAVSFLPLVMMRGLSTYLEHYSNYCTEQTVSAATPGLIAAVRPEFALNAADAARAPLVVNRAIATLRNRQNGEGGFGIWTATPVADPFVSVYAMHYLLLARQAGLNVPADMLERGMGYLRRMAADESLGDLDGLRARAFAIYLLTSSGQVTTNFIASVQQRLQTRYPAVWKNDLAAVYLASSYHLLKQDAEANRLIQAPYNELIKPRPARLPWRYAYYYDPLIADAQTLYLIEKNFPALAAKVPEATLIRIIEPIQQGRYNTLSAALTLFALSDLPQGQAKPDGLSLLQSAAKPGADANTDAVFQPFGDANGAVVTGNLASDSTQMRFAYAPEDGATAPAWYSLSQAGYDRVQPTKTIKDGLEIVREYTDESGKPIQKVALGQTIDVHISLRALGDRAVGDVAIVDILPGGFEVVSNPPPAPSVQDSSTEQSSDEPDAGTADQNTDDDAAPMIANDPLAQPGSDMEVSYVEPREDRVLIYAMANRDVQQYIYRIRPTNTGRFIVPPEYAASMYDRTLRAYTPGDGVLTVTSPDTPSDASTKSLN